VEALLSGASGTTAIRQCLQPLELNAVAPEEPVMMTDATWMHLTSVGRWASWTSELGEIGP
jgi:hypothetical protein